MGRIKIVTDGIPKNTKIIDMDTGEEIKGAYSIDYHIDKDDVGRATIKFVKIPVELQLESSNLNSEYKSYSSYKLVYPKEQNE